MDSPHVLLAPDSFKESLTAREAAQAMQAGVREVFPDARTTLRPLSDGGEGFLDAMRTPATGTMTSRVRSATGEYVEAEWLRLGDRAWIEVAEVVGLAGIPVGQRRPMGLDTRGLGALIRQAMDAGCVDLVIGLGGTGTCDGGAGMLAELGIRFMDAGGHGLEPTPEALRRLDSIDRSSLDARLAEVSITIATDVSSPLTGPAGAAPVFGPQKGAGPEEVAELDRLLASLSFLLEADLPESHAAVPGAGAAGGLGWALMLLGAQVRPGFDVVADHTGLAGLVEACDIVLTGEGCFDAQSLAGKVVPRLAQLSASLGKPCHALVGRAEDVDHQTLQASGITSVAVITPADQEREQALGQAASNVERATTKLLGRLRTAYLN